MDVALYEIKYVTITLLLMLCGFVYACVHGRCVCALACMAAYMYMCVRVRVRVREFAHAHQ